MYGIYENGAVIAKFVAPMTVRSNHPTFVSDTLSLSRQAMRRAAQRWEIETQLEPLSYSAQDLFVNIVTKGYSGATQVLVPQNYGVIHTRTSVNTPVVTGTAGQSIVNVTSNSGLIPKGTFIKFSNHSKVYLNTGDLSGNGPMTIYPNLATTLTSSPTVTMNHRDDVIMTCSYDLDVTMGMVYTDGILMDLGTIKLIERLT